MVEELFDIGVIIINKEQHQEKYKIWTKLWNRKSYEDLGAICTNAI